MKSVYVVSQNGGPVKIGVANDPVRRACAFRTASPVKVTLVFHAGVEGDAMAVERAAHEALKGCRLAGEWFSCDVTEAVQALQSAASRIGVKLVQQDHVKGTPWQIRLKAAALNQKSLASMLGLSENTVSRQMKGDWAVAGYVEAFVSAWEIMTIEQRAEWIKRRERKP